MHNNSILFDESFLQFSNMFQYQYLFWSLLNQVEHVEMLDLR